MPSGQPYLAGSAGAWWLKPQPSEPRGGSRHSSTAAWRPLPLSLPRRLPDVTAAALQVGFGWALGQRAPVGRAVGKTKPSEGVGVPASRKGRGTIGQDPGQARPMLGLASSPAASCLALNSGALSCPLVTAVVSPSSPPKEPPFLGRPQCLWVGAEFAAPPLRQGAVGTAPPA